MSFFSGLRRVNRRYPNRNAFVNDNALHVSHSAPNGTQGVFSAPSVQLIPGGGSNPYRPGYELSNNRFVSIADVNSVMRNNDVGGIRNVFGNLNANQLNGVSTVRRMDNVPDALMHSTNLRKQSVRSNYPSANTRTQPGVENFLERQPRLQNYLSNAKQAGVVALIGLGAVLAFRAVTLVGDILDALNATGGSYYYTGLDGGDTVNGCVLRFRSCGVNPADIPGDAVCQNFLDPILINDETALRAICQGYNREREGTVCRGSDPNADETSPQYVDVSQLPVNTSIACVEPYDLSDLIGDLGLDWLLDDDGLISKSSNSATSASNSLMPLIIAIGVILFVVFIGYIIFKRVSNTQTVAMQQPMVVAAR